MVNIYKEAGARIMLTRTMRGYTRECLAELAGISSKFLYEIECGKKGFTARVLYNICKELKVNCDYIMTGNESGVCDQRIISLLGMFDKGQTEKLGNVLKGIYDLILSN